MLEGRLQVLEVVAVLLVVFLLVLVGQSLTHCFRNGFEEALMLVIRRHGVDSSVNSSKDHAWVLNSFREVRSARSSSLGFCLQCHFGSEYLGGVVDDDQAMYATNGVVTSSMD